MLIIADDFTGAADAAVGFIASGFSAKILLDDWDCQAGSDVIALDLDTRHRTAGEAREKVRKALANIAAGHFVFKKIDSTLRGQIGAELHVLSKAIKDRAAPMFIAPAIPENGRKVIDGRVFVRGVPLEETDIWRHESAAFDGELPARLSERLTLSGLRVEEIHLSTLREGVRALSACLLELRAAGVEAVILDTKTPEDLSIIAKTAVSFDKMPVCVGAAGLAHALGRLMAQGEADKPVALSTPATPVLLAIASQSRTARAQIEYVSARADVATIEITNAVESCIERAGELLASGHHVLLCPPEAAQGSLNRDYATSMAQIVAKVACHAGALIASGGDTARACLQFLGYNRIDVEDELAPGVVLSHPSDRPDLSFVSKAGDFGETETLSNCIDKLTLLSRGTDS